MKSMKHSSTFISSLSSFKITNSAIGKDADLQGCIKMKVFLQENCDITS